MKKIALLYGLLFFLMFFPVIDISGHFINLVEFYIYILFAFNIKKLTPVPTIKVFIVYIILFFITVVFTAAMAGKGINNYDIFVLRNSAQLVCLLSVLHITFREMSKEKTSEEFQKIIMKSFYILSLPAVLIYLERFNLFGARDWVQVLYKPQFFFLDAELFSEFRYTSVFKDFFTAGVYFIVLTGGIFYFYLTAQLKKTDKLKLILLMIMIYIAQLFVSRSSLILIPLNLILMILFASKGSFLNSVKNLILLMLVIVPLLIVAINVLINLNIVRGEWVSEGLNIVMNHSDGNASSSFTVMQEWNHNFYRHVTEHPEVLFVPNHEYDLKESSTGNLYTDGFYPQEIYRYGIYGILAYLYLVIYLLKNFIKKHRGLMIMVFSFVVLNYKGGNVFFMPKNVYLYAFIIAAFLTLDCMKAENENLKK